MDDGAKTQTAPWFQRQSLAVKVMFCVMLAAGPGLGSVLIGWAASQIF